MYLKKTLLNIYSPAKIYNSRSQKLQFYFDLKNYPSKGQGDSFISLVIIISKTSPGSALLRHDIIAIDAQG